MGTRAKAPAADGGSRSAAREANASSSTSIRRQAAERETPSPANTKDYRSANVCISTCRPTDAPVGVPVSASSHAASACPNRLLPPPSSMPAPPSRGGGRTGGPAQLPALEGLRPNRGGAHPRLGTPLSRERQHRRVGRALGVGAGGATWGVNFATPDPPNRGRLGGAASRSARSALARNRSSHLAPSGHPPSCRKVARGSA